MYGRTDVGLLRKMNQDCHYFNADQGIAVVCDGIGGRKGGEVASSIAVKGMTKAFLNCDSLRQEEISPFLTSAVDKVNQQILNKGKIDASIEGMGTTLNCLLFVGDSLYIAHIGDSRTYLYYKGHFWQLTLDHNMEVYVERGWLPKESLLGSSKPGALVRALGLGGQVEVDIYEKVLRPGEIILTCSDGLTSMVSDRKICSLIRENENRLDVLPKILISEANKNGGRDNTTVVITEVVKG